MGGDGRLTVRRTVGYNRGGRRLVFGYGNFAMLIGDTTMNTNTNETKRVPALSVEVSLNTTDTPLDPNNGIMITFADGTQRWLNVGDLPNEVLAMAVLHGLKQKLVDAAAISRNPDTGKSASVADKRAAVEAVMARLLGGAWNAARGEGGTGAGGLLFRALVQLYAGKKSAEDIREFLAGKDKKEQAALRKNPRVAAIIAELRDSDAADGVDTDDMLSELED